MTHDLPFDRLVERWTQARADYLAVHARWETAAFDSPQDEQLEEQMFFQDSWLTLMPAPTLSDLIDKALIQFGEAIETQPEDRHMAQLAALIINMQMIERGFSGDYPVVERLPKESARHIDIKHDALKRPAVSPSNEDEHGPTGAARANSGDAA